MRNFRHANGRSPIPGRIEWNSAGPFEVAFTAIQTAARSGLRRNSSTVEPIKSKVRFSAKSIPSKTGGLSSNSGTDSPGTNSARWINISIVEGAIRTRTPL